MNQTAINPPHVLIFPLPFQGPLNCTLRLAEHLCLAGFHVTFLNTDHIQTRLFRYTDVQTRFSRFPRFRFETVPDGLPEDHPRSCDRFMEMYDALEAVSGPIFKEMLVSGRFSPDTTPPVTCLIPDGVFAFGVEIAEEIGIPVIYFDTISPCCLLINLSIPKLIESGELPFKENNLDAPITSVPGMEGFLRRRDLPSFCRFEQLDNPIMRLVLNKDQHLPKAHGLILNTFEEIEGPTLSHLRSHCPNLYPIGPLLTHINNRTASKTTSPQTFSNSLWQEDGNCLTWLDEQPLKSVIFVSFGSLAVSTVDELMEFWHGLVNSGNRFLWVIRPNAFPGGNLDRQIPVEVSIGTKERGLIVEWAPQQEVLGHPAIGGFLTHSGWNSTLESIVAGVPMICWPYFVDQQVNSRFVSEVWKLGLDMKDTCDRVVIEKMVNDLMGSRRDEFVQSADQLAKLASESVSEGGSSCCSLDRLIEDIRLMSKEVPHV